MKNIPFFAVLIALILGIIYVMKATDNPPETGMTQTPREYIEYIEQKKAARQSEDITPTKQ